MARPFVYSSLVAGLLCGCQSAQHQACCDDCLPKQTPSCGYMPKHDSLLTQWTAKSCAHEDLKQVRKNCGKVSKHFADGFEQAYVDQAMGRPAATPPVPASKYWNAYYRSCAGADDVAEWFEGYRLGLEIGGQGGVSRFNRVASSWQTGGGCPDGACHSEAATSPQPQTVAPAYPWQAQAGGTPSPDAASGRYSPVAPAVHASAFRPNGS
ncbi:MAG: hypothetical protein SFV23_12400 [Planctomycetaceae bacterium]|nr:hypothetical protein [Planctomycetaceae bacterium]